LKLNDKIEGVIELASLNPFAEHEIEFIEKLGETLASAIITVRSAESTNMLLEQTQAAGGGDARTGRRNAPEYGRTSGNSGTNASQK
jgi:hypothetical protein